MSYRQKKALEIALRDAMDGMEALASLFAYRRLPEDLEILGIGKDIDPPENTVHPALATAEVISLAKYRRSFKPEETTSQLGTSPKTLQKKL